MQNNATRKRRAAAAQPAQSTIFGQNMTFAAKEAYKLLRTNLLFALPEPTEGRGYIIGVTSSLRGEGKSTTTINLGAALAEPDTALRLFGKPMVQGQRRVGVTLARAADVDQARAIARDAAAAIGIELR